MDDEPRTMIDRTTGNVFAALGLPDAEELVHRTDHLIALRAYLRRESASEAGDAALLGATPDELSALWAGGLTPLSEKRVAEMYDRLPVEGGF